MKTDKKSGSAAHKAGHHELENLKLLNDDANQTDPEGVETTGTVEQLSQEEQEMAAKKAYGELKAFGPKTLPIAIKLGNLLTTLKAQIKHGDWTDYTNKLLSISPRSASDYMLLAKHGAELKTAKFADFGIVEALNYLRSKKESPSAEKFQFILADDRKITWREGVITPESVQMIIDRYAPESQEKIALKRAAHKQEAVIRVASTANQVSEASVPERLQDANNALQMVQQLLVNAE